MERRNTMKYHKNILKIQNIRATLLLVLFKNRKICAIDNYMEDWIGIDYE